MVVRLSLQVRKRHVSKDSKEAKLATWPSGEVTFSVEVTARAGSRVDMYLVHLRSCREARAGEGEGTRDKHIDEDKEAF